MITQYEVPAYLATQLPGLKENLQHCSPALNIFKTIQCFADYTRSKLINHDLKAVKNAFSIAEEIYISGNTMVKNAVENIYIYSFSTLMMLCNKEEKIAVQAAMPIVLHTAYVQQVLKSGL